FAIRNSGLYAAVEGVGDHGCEYMTGGRVVIIGKTGRNFAAGMSGGIAYCLDPQGDFHRRCNLDMVRLEKLTAEDGELVLELLRRHYKYTNSKAAQQLLKKPQDIQHCFVKVMPVEYKRILESKGVAEELQLVEVSDG
ncbi:MAG: hypothetical protein ACOY3D_02740, partial [Candidatus Omnitrophota bacterium]